MLIGCALASVSIDPEVVFDQLSIDPELVFDQLNIVPEVVFHQLLIVPGRLRHFVPTLRLRPPTTTSNQTPGHKPERWISQLKDVQTMADRSKSKSVPRTRKPAPIPETSHLRLLSFSLSDVVIQGSDWMPRDPATPGSLQVYRIGSSCVHPARRLPSSTLNGILRIYIRIVGVVPYRENEEEDEEMDEVYAPTFNVQKELVRFHVSRTYCSPLPRR